MNIRCALVRNRKQKGNFSLKRIFYDKHITNETNPLRMEYTPLVFMAIMFVLFTIAGCMNQVDWFSYKEPVPDPRPKLSKYLRYSNDTDFNDLSTRTQHGWWIDENSPTGYIRAHHYWCREAKMAVPIGCTAEKSKEVPGGYTFETSGYGMG